MCFIIKNESWSYFHARFKYFFAQIELTQENCDVVEPLEVSDRLEMQRNGPQDSEGSDENELVSGDNELGKGLPWFPVFEAVVVVFNRHFTLGKVDLIQAKCCELQATGTGKLERAVVVQIEVHFVLGHVQGSDQVLRLIRPDSATIFMVRS